MPPADVHIDDRLVRSLLADQHPDLADAPLVPFANGWDNVLFRLGDDLLVRLPRRAASAELVGHEQRWLPELAPHLPVQVPLPVRAGGPGHGYPWRWSIVPWLPGTTLADATVGDHLTLADDLARFIVALHRPAPVDAPANPYRGIPLAGRHERTVDGIARLRPADGVDRVVVGRLWEHLVGTPPWEGPPLWLHGDLHPANLLVHDGRLAGVVDFGDLTAGDPACDLAVAWSALPHAGRRRFRERLRHVDADTWTRARGWALALAVAYLQASDDDPALGRVGRSALRQVLGDSG